MYTPSFIVVDVFFFFFIIINIAVVVDIDIIINKVLHSHRFVPFLCLVSIAKVKVVVDVVVHNTHLLNQPTSQPSIYPNVYFYLNPSIPICSRVARYIFWLDSSQNKTWNFQNYLRVWRYYKNLIYFCIIRIYEKFIKNFLWLKILLKLFYKTNMRLVPISGTPHSYENRYVAHVVYVYMS